MPKQKLKGIGGWLIFPIIGLFISIPILLYDLKTYFSLKNNGKCY